jgi:hypothetical protein
LSTPCAVFFFASPGVDPWVRQTQCVNRSFSPVYEFTEHFAFEMTNGFVEQFRAGEVLFEARPSNIALQILILYSFSIYLYFSMSLNSYFMSCFVCISCHANQLYRHQIVHQPGGSDSRSVTLGRSAVSLSALLQEATSRPVLEPKLPLYAPLPTSLMCSISVLLIVCFVLPQRNSSLCLHGCL